MAEKCCEKYKFGNSKIELIINNENQETTTEKFNLVFLTQPKLENVPLMIWNIFFPDEATFNSNRIVSSQNCRWWANNNPNFTIKTSDQYSFRTNVWCAIYKERIIRPFAFRKLMISQRPLTFFIDIFHFIGNLTLHEWQQVSYLQDGATCHNTLEEEGNIWQIRVM